MKIPRDEQDQYQALARLWTLRILACPAVVSQIRRIYHSSSIFESLGFNAEKLLGDRLPDEQDADQKRRETSTLQGWLRSRVNEQEAKAPALPESLARNLRFLASRLRLRTAEQLVIAARVMLELDDTLSETLGSLNIRTDARLASVLSVMLDLPKGEIARTLDPNGSLTQLRLIKRGYDPGGFDERVKLLSGLGREILLPHRSSASLFTFVARRAPASTVTVQDYPHLREHLEMLEAYLRNAIQTRRAGVNVLLYGEPGVGKTQLARLLANRVDVTLFEVQEEHLDLAPFESDSRQAKYRLLQALFARRKKALILFDEMEDIMPYERRTLFDAGDRNSGQRKAWMNRLLETNRVPTIWISNQVSHVDTAFLRRFGYVVKVETPPRSVKRRMVADALAPFAPSEEFLDRTAEQQGLAPAHLETIREVLVACETSKEQFSRRFDLLRDEQMEALGDPRRRSRYPFPALWRPELVNADVDPVALAERLREAEQANILLYGPPGTGKTALAHWLSKALDRPLMLKRASDLHAPWFGETEQLLGRMFREAERDGALLLLDEADSFLYDRRSAQQSWEVAHVNELLTQMECFNGIFICATNFSDTLDAAAARRFSVKIRFDWLRTDQAVLAFYDALELLSVPAEDREEQARHLDSLGPMTPGDFKAAMNAVRFTSETPTAPALLRALKEQIDARNGGSRRSIGFGCTAH